MVAGRGVNAAYTLDRIPKYSKAGIVCIVAGSGPQFGEMLNRFFHQMKFFELLLIA
jgi:hypothetical protein